MTSRPPELNAHALIEHLDALAAISGPGAGVTRLAYSEAWCRAHQWLAARAHDLGLTATPDSAGNLLFHSPGQRLRDPSRPMLLVGSHLDTVLNRPDLAERFKAIEQEHRRAEAARLWTEPNT